MTLLTRRALTCLSLATLAALPFGCSGKAVRNTTIVPAAAKPIVRDATQEELLDKYNLMATGVRTVNATVELKPIAGSRYSGVIEEYHEVKAFLLAARPAYIRMIGQAPVIGTTVFDMASDADTFKVSIPPKNKFLVGPVALERNSSKAIENLRPHHLLDALLWPEIRKEEPLVSEEFNDENARYYILTVLRGVYRTEIVRKIWFDRADLQVARLQAYGPKGALLSDVHLSDWQPLAADSGQSGNGGAAASSSDATTPAAFPRSIRVDRPHDDYRLDLQITKVVLNQDIPPDRFKLDQPAGSELVQVNAATDVKPGDKPQ